MAKKKTKVDKPFNNKTMTEAAFFGMLKSSWRKLSMYWIPTKIVRESARRPYTGTNKRKKWEYQCNQCKGWFDGNNVQVDHIHGIGVCSSFDDLPRVAKAMFCEADGLQVLCSKCHLAKTKTENAEMRRVKKEKKNLEM